MAKQSPSNKSRDEQEEMTFFEIQEEAWFANNCQGNIEDYGDVSNE